MSDFWFWVLLVVGCSAYTFGWIKYYARRDRVQLDTTLMVRENELDGQVTAMASDMDRELYRLLYGSSS